MVVDLTWDQVLTWRVGRHHLTTRAGEPVPLVSELAGVQAQVMASARQVIGIRSRAGPDDVDRLLWTERRLVKTWAVRGTLHLLPSDELGVWAAALRARAPRITAGWERYHGVTAAELDAITDAIPDVLDDEPLTREQLADRIAARLKRSDLAEVLRSGWAAVLKPAANHGLLIQGPPVNGAVTFVDPARWLGRSPEELASADPDGSMAAILERFLDIDGPATEVDFARWLGVQPAHGRRLLAEHSDRLQAVSVGGTRAWMTPKGAAAATRVKPTSKPTVFLLPGFDPYVIAPISHRRHTIPDGRVEEVSRSAGWISPVLLVNGRMAGTWALGEDKSTVTLTPFGPLAPEVVEAATRHLRSRYRATLGPELELAVA